MNIHLIAIGNRMPRWVEEGYQEYAKRLGGECQLRLVEINPAKRGKGAPTQRAMAQEGERLRAAIPKGARVVTLEVTGKSWSTEQLSGRLRGWMDGGEPITLLVGGADGLDPSCLALARERWSLSPLTLPHPLVRIVVAEQLYRAWSLLKGHPYHRG